MYVLGVFRWEFDGTGVVRAGARSEERRKLNTKRANGVPRDLPLLVGWVLLVLCCERDRYLLKTDEQNCWLAWLRVAGG